MICSVILFVICKQGTSWRLLWSVKSQILQMLIKCSVTSLVRIWTRYSPRNALASINEPALPTGTNQCCHRKLTLF